ncbi:MAG: Zn-dependent oligopeptidase [Propionibacteriales bacterium]|nr:Zn-dependent oligopeptidase [Propionibacteriales bacterium]
MTHATDLVPLELPSDPTGWSDWLRSRCDDNLDLVRTRVADLKRQPPSEPHAVLSGWNDIMAVLRSASSVAGLMSQVHPEEEIRTQAEAAQQETSRLSTDVSLDRELYDLLSRVDASTLDAGADKVLSDTLRDIRRAGVDKDESTRTRLRAISDEETLLEQEFSKGIRDSVLEVSLDPSQLGGLPLDFVAGHPTGDDGRVIVTTDYPDAYPFLSFAADAAARRDVMLAFNNRAWPQNDAVLTQLLALRAEHARLLGFDGWPDYDAEIKMIGRGAAIAAFIDEIATAAEESGRRDRAVLLDRLKVDHPEATDIDRADTTYYAEVVRRERFDVDAQQVRTYFDFAKVRAGLLDVTGRLFGLSYTLVPGATTWHEDVAAYDVHAEGGLLGRIYLDLHPREGKYKHAAQFDLVAGMRGRQLPEGALVCNFPRGLMEHRDVVTLFHEFGHLVHHVLAGRHDWSRFSGVATEWDFVEAPSQLLEEWAWHSDVLRTFATDESGEPIPAALVDRMRAANEFGKGYQARTQMFYAAVSYWLHHRRGDDLTAQVRDLQSTYDLFPFIEGTHFHASFGHLGGYSSAYYTYMWSLVVAKDLFSAFDPADLMDTEVSHRYRDQVLAAGGSKDAADLVADFLGRPYNADAFNRWLAAAPGLAG